MVTVLSDMKILHLFSNWKWTGPAEHALNTVVMLMRAGHDVTFACAAPPADAPESLAAEAIKAGITPVTAFTLNKHFNNILLDTKMGIRIQEEFKMVGGEYIPIRLGTKTKILHQTKQIVGNGQVMTING